MKRARKVASPQGITMVALPDGLLISSPRGQFILRTTASDPNFEIEDQDSSETDACTLGSREQTARMDEELARSA
jgi:hypothetical protein